MDGWMGGWMDGWMDGCMDGWMDDCMDGFPIIRSPSNCGAEDTDEKPN